MNIARNIISRLLGFRFHPEKKPDFHRLQSAVCVHFKTDKQSCHFTVFLNLKGEKQSCHFAAFFNFKTD